MRRTHPAAAGRPVRRPVLMSLLALLSACAAEDGPTDPGADGPGLDPDVPPVVAWTGWRPPPGLTWRWQLQGDVPTDRDVDAYDIDLFDPPDATFTALEARGVRVICYLSAGSWEEWRADAGAFPAAVRGRPLDGWPGERWLDIRSARVVELMEARLDHARARGCDAVELDNVTGWNDDTGFPLSRLDQLAYNRALANAAHTRGLAVALKNAGDLVPDLVDWFDFEINEECFAYDECDDLMPFVDAGKAVLSAEYAPDEATARARAATVCPDARHRGFTTLFLPLDLDGTWEVACGRPPG